MRQAFKVLGLLSGLVLVLAGCGNAASANGSHSVTLTLGAFSTPQQVFAKLIPIFQAQWKQQTGQTVTFRQSYQGSGTQAKAIIAGFEADVAALAMAPDIDAIAKAGLITHDWTATPTHGMVADSVVAFAVRKGNPKGIHDWADLARPGIQVLTPNAQTSGGARWNILALYGAALRGEVRGVAKGDPAGAMAFLKAVLKNVVVMDKDARGSITDFEGGVGDVAITYESEVLLGQHAGASEDLVIPSSSILIEQPAAVVDAYAKQHGTLAVAQAFVTFLTSDRAQAIFASTGYLRPVTASAQTQSGGQFQPVSDLWTISTLGGWNKATTQFFGTSGVYTQAIASVQGG